MCGAKVTTQNGFTLLELLTTLAVVGIVGATLVSNIRILENPLLSTSATMTNYFRLVRARAISQTKSIRVAPQDNRKIIATSVTSCSATTGTPQNDLTLSLDNDVTLASTSWTACFTPRGLVDDYVTFSFRTSRASKSVQIALGGGVKIQ